MSVYLDEYSGNPSPPESDDETNRPGIKADASIEAKIEANTVVKMETDEEAKNKLVGSEFLANKPMGAMANIHDCKVCKARMNSEESWVRHVKGKRHKRKYIAACYKVPDPQSLSNNGCNVRHVKIAGAPMFINTQMSSARSRIQDIFDDHIGAPIIGLGFVLEIQFKDPKAEPVYNCFLCPADCQYSSLINHVTGFKHRMSYLKLQDPERYDRLNTSTDRKCTLTERMENFAKKMEIVDGRGSVVVEKQVDPKTDPILPDFDHARPFPLLPKSLVPLLISQTQRLSEKDKIEFFQVLTKSVSEQINLEPGELNIVCQGHNRVLNNYINDVMHELNTKPEAQERSLKLLLEGNYMKFYEETFHVPVPGFLSLIKPIITQVMKEKEQIMRNDH